MLINKMIKITKYFFLLAFIFLASGRLIAQDTPKIDLDKKFSVTELKMDLKVFRENMEKLHIGIDTYTPKSELDRAFDEIESELTEPMTALELFNKLIRLNKKIGNVHTAISPPKPIWDGIKKQLPLFPFEVYWYKDSLYVLKNLSNNKEIKDGSKIKTINGRSAYIVFKQMVETIRRDGYNKSYPIKRSEYSFAIIYAAQNEMPDVFALELQAPSGEINNVKIEPLPTEKINANHLTRYKKTKKRWEETKDPALKLSINDDIAIMRIRTFQIDQIKKKKQNWKKFFKRSFNEIKNKDVNHLIIDLRDNGGGQPEPTIRLLSYLHDKPFTIYRSINTKVNKIPNAPYFVKDGSVKTFNSYKWIKQGDLFELDLKSEYKIHRPAKIHYQGKLYVLINAFSASATGTFLGQLKSLTNAIFIGQEAGGNPNQTVARQIVKMELPNSKVQVSIPLVLSIKNVNFENQGRGVIPDHQIKPAIEDLLNNRDVTLEFTLNLINKQK